MSGLSPVANAKASTEHIEFQAPQEARNYRAAMAWEFRDFLRGNVVEIGAGIGQMTGHLIGLPDIKRLISIKPDAGFCARHRAQFPWQELLEGGMDAGPPSWPCDALPSISVLEPIEQDGAELQENTRLLEAQCGTFWVLVPARAEIYATIGGDFGHLRHYTRPELRRKPAFGRYFLAVAPAA